MRAAHAVAIVLAVLLSSSPARAQEWLKLESGSTLRGETVEETPESVRFVDLDARVHVVPRSEIRRLARKAFAKPVAAKLEALTTRDAASLVELARWAAGEKGCDRDAPRLALLALAHDPEHVPARELLGHVRVFDTWYSDAKSAQEALAERMTADGYVAWLEGWVKAEHAEAIAADPASFLLVENMIWRPLAEVMIERGFRLFEGEWYPTPDHDLVDRLADLKARTKIVAQAARSGACEVYCVLGREAAQEHADNLNQARAWFVETFVARPEGSSLLADPISRVYVLEDPAQLETFANAYAQTLGVSPEQRDFAMQQGHLTWRGLGHALTTKHSAWKNLVVSQLGGDLTKYVWGGKTEIPAFLWVASAHSAEIEVLGGARVQYVAPDRYGKKTDLPVVTGRGIKEVKELARDLVKEKKAPSLREIWLRHFNELRAGDNVFGLAVFRWLIEERREPFLGYMTATGTTAAPQRVATAFGAGFEELEIAFHAWLET